MFLGGASRDASNRGLGIKQVVYIPSNYNHIGLSCIFGGILWEGLMKVSLASKSDWYGYF